VTLFSLIALVILLLAAINFMNLSTAQASTRLKEIGVKKAVGADRMTLLIKGQFVRNQTGELLKQNRQIYVRTPGGMVGDKPGPVA
jgi:hypothetical protein